MDLGLTGKVVLITGGSKGIGLACAAAFAAEGARIAICSRSQANLDRALATLPGVLGFAADLCDPDAAARMVDAVTGQLGPVDILVNSAGAAKRMAPDDLTPRAWRAAMDSKYFSTINVIDPVVKRMAERGRGVIVNVIGVGGKVASPVHVAGGAANAALMLATAGLGAAYAARGVRVLGVSPGMTETGRVAERLQAEARLASISLEEARARNVARIPMGRMAAPAEIASAVVFLASDQASYITAVTVAMDGGRNPAVL
ncbi:MAG: SDR family oxidoreductase [Holophaga sp.]|nr:SDR family oxidoreductase [Holophaga sp.]